MIFVGGREFGSFTRIDVGGDEIFGIFVRGFCNVETKENTWQCEFDLIDYHYLCDLTWICYDDA